jgi:hypothetical protein
MVTVYTSCFDNQSHCIDLVWLSIYPAIIFLNGINQVIILKVKCGVLFEVRTIFLYTI